MSFLSNIWVGYSDRTYEQIKQSVIAEKFPLYLPEVTDHSESNILIRMISIWAGIAEMLNYQVDSAAREALLDSCRLYPNAVRLSRMLDYRVKPRIAATVDLVFTINQAHSAPITIPSGTDVETSDGINFKTLKDGIIPIGSLSVQVPSQQVSSGYGSSLISQSEDGKVYLGNKKVADGTLTLDSGGSIFYPQETLGYSYPTNKHFILTISTEGRIMAQFGDGVNGEAVVDGISFLHTFRETEGADGNVDADTVTQLVTVLTLPTGIQISSVTNPRRASGGSEIENLKSIKRRVPMSLRTKLRAVTRKDFKDIASLAPGVERGGVVFECGKSIDIYIVPNGGGLASVALRDSVEDFFDDKKIYGTNLKCYSAGTVYLTLKILVRHLPSAPVSALSEQIKANLVNFNSFNNQEIQGRNDLSDLYQTIENTEGVVSSDIELMYPVPYARPLYDSDVLLIWDREQTENSLTQIKWTIVMISDTQYQLQKEGDFAGTFSIDEEVVKSEVVFTVADGGYSIGNRWEFYTYPVNKNLILNEPSIIITRPSDIQLEMQSV